MQDLLTYSEAAKVLGIPRGTLYALVHQGRVPHIRFGKRLVRFSREALEGFIEEHTVPASGETPRRDTDLVQQEVSNGL